MGRIRGAASPFVLFVLSGAITGFDAMVAIPACEREEIRFADLRRIVVAVFIVSIDSRGLDNNLVQYVGNVSVTFLHWKMG